MEREPLGGSIGAYNPDTPLAEACTIPSAWYTDPRVFELERATVFTRNWQLAARLDQVAESGKYVTTNLGGDPIVVVRGTDGELRGFFNVCRHHAAEVATGSEGTAKVLRCPYHGWTYGLDGALRGMPEFDSVCGFDKADHGLKPVATETWEQFVFVRLDHGGPNLLSFLGDLARRVTDLNLASLQFYQRTQYEIRCNWKVFVDNYLDGGYHVPHIHKGLGSVLDCRNYAIEVRDRFCAQSSPIKPEGGEAATAAVRRGDMAYYYWLYPNLMLNWYQGYMDTNLVLPLDVDRTRVVFDFYFDPNATDRPSSIDVANRIQEEDVEICESVQRGLQSRAYDVGRLSVLREAGEHLFHRLLFQDLSER